MESIPGAVIATLALFGAQGGPGSPSILRPSRFWEELRPITAVAGENLRLRGLQYVQPDAFANLSQLGVVLPPGDNAQLCLVVETQDGGYYATASYAIAGLPTGRRFAVQMDTKHRSLLEARAVRDISVLAFVARDCEGKDRLFVPVSWGPAAGTLMLLVNTRAPGVEVELFYDGREKPFRCDRDEKSARTTAFDTECSLVPAGEKRRVPLILTFTNLRGNRSEEPFEAYLP